MDYYNTLGIPRDATQEEIKKAFRKLAMIHHPDKGGNPTEFQKLNDAYEVLGDPAKRQQYDNPTSHNSLNDSFQFDQHNFDLKDLFSHIFGAGRGPAAGFSQQQIFRTQVAISLVDAYNGKEHTLQLSTPSGAKIINVKVPSGIDSGDQVRYQNVIDNGTLIIGFHIMPDLRFDRKGNDLHCNLPVSVLDLIVGTKVNFNTIAGKTVEVTIPPNTQPSHQIRLHGLGMPIKNSPNIYGDQILLLKPYLPDNISTDIIESINRFKLNT